MAVCEICGKRFNVDDAEDDYLMEFDGDPEYYDQFNGHVCGDCAISITYENLSAGGELIDLMGSGYDDD